jgi:hypothetical protein
MFSGAQYIHGDAKTTNIHAKMKRKVGALEKIEADHAALRYKIKRDPQSYRDDFDAQFQQYQTLRDLYLASPENAETGIVALKDLSTASQTLDMNSN